MKAAESLVYLVMVTAWVCGIATAKGFWLTTLCVLVPPAAWVLLAERLMGGLA